MGIIGTQCFLESCGRVYTLMSRKSPSLSFQQVALTSHPRAPVMQYSRTTHCNRCRRWRKNGRRWHGCRPAGVTRDRNSDPRIRSDVASSGNMSLMMRGISVVLGVCSYHAGNGICLGHSTRIFDDSSHPVLIGDHYYLVQSCNALVPAYAGTAVFWIKLDG
jgi:hypothetical protein